MNPGKETERKRGRCFKQYSRIVWHVQKISATAAAKNHGVCHSMYSTIHFRLPIQSITLLSLIYPFFTNIVLRSTSDNNEKLIMSFTSTVSSHPCSFLHVEVVYFNSVWEFAFLTSLHHLTHMTLLYVVQLFLVVQHFSLLKNSIKNLGILLKQIR